MSQDDLPTKVSETHTKGVEQFGFTWLACHEIISAAFRQAVAVDPYGAVPYPLRYAACQIAWAWCSDLAALKGGKTT